MGQSKKKVKMLEDVLLSVLNRRAYKKGKRIG